MTAAPHDESRYGTAFVCVLILLVLIAFAVRWRLHPISAKGLDVPAAEFSAGRALGVLSDILADEHPHPVDSRAAADVRQRIVDRLQRLNYQVEIQDTTSCRKFQIQTCARVRNLIAIHRGTGTGKTILLTAHYDSVPAGPGASDDGSGVAILLEIARLLKGHPPTQNSVILLFSEGEEAGLLGAEAFATEHPLVKSVALAINTEARGTTGQSALFETGHGSGRLIDIFASTSKRPLTNSMLNEVYKLLANDTDLTIFNALGLPGLNFAYGERLPFYHTPKDSLRELDAGSLQQQGDNIYNVVAALLDVNLSVDGTIDDRVYTDIFGIGVIRWPASWGLPLAIVLLMAFVVATLLLRRRHPYSIKSVIAGIACFPLSLVLGGGAAYLLIALLEIASGGSVTPWHSAEIFNRVLLWSFVLLFVVWFQGLLFRKSNPVGFWVGIGYVWSSAGVLTALLIPGISYLFMLPCLAFLAVTLFGMRNKRIAGITRFSTPLVVSAVAAFMIIFPSIYLVEIMVGFNTLPGSVGAGVFLGLAAMLAVPLAGASTGTKAFKYSGYLGVAVVFVSGFMSIRAPAYAETQPLALNIKYIQNSDGKSYIFAGVESLVTPLSVLNAMGPEVSLQYALPWVKARFYTVPAAPIAMVPPNVSVVTDEQTTRGRELTVSINAGQFALNTLLLIPRAAGLLSMEMDGHVMAYAEAASEIGDYKAFFCRGESCDGKQIKLVLTEKTPQEILVVKIVAGLPVSAELIVESRNASAAVPQNDGDLSYIATRVRL